jgi:hypothetical protein
VAQQRVELGGVAAHDAQFVVGAAGEVGGLDDDRQRLDRLLEAVVVLVGGGGGRR